MAQKSRNRSLSPHISFCGAMAINQTLTARFSRFATYREMKCRFDRLRAKQLISGALGLGHAALRSVNYDVYLSRHRHLSPLTENHAQDQLPPGTPPISEPHLSHDISDKLLKWSLNFMCRHMYVHLGSSAGRC